MPGTDNNLADIFNFSFHHNREWELHAPILQPLFRQLGMPRWDLFTTASSHKLLLWGVLGQGSQGDTLLLSWAPCLCFTSSLPFHFSRKNSAKGCRTRQLSYLQFPSGPASTGSQISFPCLSAHRSASHNRVDSTTLTRAPFTLWPGIWMGFTNR